jgi:hypothetical protein
MVTGRVGNEIRTELLDRSGGRCPMIDPDTDRLIHKPSANFVIDELFRRWRRFCDADGMQPIRHRRR